MYKTEEEQKLENEANKYTYLNKVIDNLKVKQQNGRLWTPYHDMQLYEYVIKYKFNFYEISNAFQKLCTNDKKYEYSEDAVRLHWAFLHAMRNFDQTPDEAYYQRMKLQYDKEKPKTFMNTVEEREKMLSEEEDIRRMKAELEKLEKEKNEKEKKIKEDKEKKEKERIEKEKKEDEEVEELISTTTKRNEEEKERSEEKNEENKDKKNKEEITKINNDNKLYDENNEPEFIKQLFSKNIPQEILDKLNKDKEKYNNNNNKDIEHEEENKNKIIEDKKGNNEKQNIINETKQTINVKEDDNNNNKNGETNIDSNLDINKEISKKEKEEKKNNNIINEEEDLFPIKSHKQKEISEPGKIENINMEKELRNTQDFNDYIESNPELKKQYDQLNNYCNFAVKSINYIVNKGAGVDNTSESEAKKIEQANKELNKLLLQPIMKKHKDGELTLEEWNKRIEEEEYKMNFETTNYDNYMKNAPKDEERDMKLNKFKEHLFGYAEKISTEELLEKITNIIGQQNNNENENNNNENNNQINNNNTNNNVNNNINLENRIQNFMNNLENNNIEDEKSENTKEQSENITENAGDDNGRNTISSVSSLEVPRKYRHVYRGMVYYNDKPDENDKRKKNRNNNNKNKKNEDDEIEEDDDDDDDDYNK